MGVRPLLYTHHPSSLPSPPCTMAITPSLSHPRAVSIAVASRAVAIRPIARVGRSQHNSETDTRPQCARRHRNASSASSHAPLRLSSLKSCSSSGGCRKRQFNSTRPCSCTNLYTWNSRKSSPETSSPSFVVKQGQVLARCSLHLSRLGRLRT